MAGLQISKHWRGRFVRYAPIILWIGVIFYLSSVSGSMTETSRFIGPLLHFLFPTAPEETIRIYHGYIRKAAHFTEYAILAWLAFRAFSASAALPVRRYKYYLLILLVFVIASIDEFNQNFQAARTGSLLDVLLDLSGGVVAITVLWLFYRRKPEPDIK